ncbi:NTCP protein, partial [Penelope pileata]|nr:NTCP protein [Penelope pileata]
SPGHPQSTSLTSAAPPFTSGQQATDTALNAILIVVLFIVMVSLGCTMEIAKITTHLRKPKGIAIAVMSQYGVMPLTAFALGKLFQLGPTESLAILICGCCPGGNLSNIFSLALKGDMNLSPQDIHSTALGTRIFSQGKVLHVYQTNTILEAASCFALLCWLVLISIYFATRMVVLLLSSVAIITLSVATVGSGITVIISPSLLGSSALMPFIGFLLGYALSAAFKLNDRCRRTVCMETGCQNVQLCSTILKVAFAPDIIGPLYLFPLLYLIFQLGEGLLLILLFRIHDRIRKLNGK